MKIARPLQPYASRTGTKKNLSALRSAGWKLLVSARGCLRSEGFAYGLDNGAWTSHQQGQPFSVESFERAVEKMGQGADWIVAPDIVEGSTESLRMSLQWLPRLRPYGLTLIAVQDGIDPDHVRGVVGSDVGVFVGGSTEWKLRSLAAWSSLSSETGCYLHVARVNTARRINLCHDARADSFDGTSATRYRKTLPLLNNATRQGQLFR